MSKRLRARWVLLLGLGVVLGVVGAPGDVAAQDAETETAKPAAPANVFSEVQRIVERFEVRRLRAREAAKAGGVRVGPAVRVERAEAREALEALVAKHRPGASGEPRDLGLAYEALFSIDLMPRGDGVFDLARRMLGGDPDTRAAWPVLSRLRDDRVLFVMGESTDGVARLRQFVTAFAPEAPRGTETRRALDLLDGYLLLDGGSAPPALKAAERLVRGGRGSPELLDAAERLRDRAGVLPAGFEAPAFRRPRYGEGEEVVLADHRGRAAFVMFANADEDFAELGGSVYGTQQIVAANELSLVMVPLINDPESASLVLEDSAAGGWNVVASGPENAAIAEAYRVGGERSALFLVGPDGKVLKSSGWDLPDAEERAAGLIRKSIGEPLALVLSAVKGGSWASFRDVWHGLAATRRPVGGAEALVEAQELGPRAVYALMLAGDRIGTPVPYPWAEPPKGRHGQLVVAWCARGTSDGQARLAELTAALAKPSGDECLALVDALFDLGLAGEDLRAGLEVVAAKSSDWRTVSMALRALAFGDTDESPEAFEKQQRHTSWQVRLALAEALGAYRHADSVDALIGLLGDKRLRVRAEAAATLAPLTAQDFGTSQKRWKEWRRTDGREHPVAPRELNAATFARRNAHRYADASSSYFGLKIASDRVVFVLDKSESMFYGLFDAVVEEVALFLSTGGPTTSFGLIEFDAEPRIWKKKLAAANPRNVKAAVAFLERAKPYGPTNVMDSLTLGFGIKGMDTVVLLSDGLPNRGAEQDPPKIRELVRKENRYTRLAIHTVWMARGRQFPHDGPRGAEKPPLDNAEKERRARIRARAPTKHPLARFLLRLAEENGGTFGIAFGDMYLPPPGARTRPSTDK